MSRTSFFDDASVADLYGWFAGEAAATSPTWQRVSRWVVAEESLHARLDALPGLARQPNRFLAALRFHGAPLAKRDELFAWVDEHWSQLRATIIARPTQTNEPGRLAVLSPLFQALPQPISLLELGASGGLCLLPDRLGPQPCEVEGEPPTVQGELIVAARLGVDLNPLDLHDEDTCRWLRCLVWPDEEDREVRLAEALEVARNDPPMVLQADLAEAAEQRIPRLVARIQDESPCATPVVFHSIALGYLSKEARVCVVAAIRRSGAHWISFESSNVVPEVKDRLNELPPQPDWGRIVAAVDGKPFAWCQPHGRRVRWAKGLGQLRMSRL